jgi:Brp/Blh family beta-carotene 15,15'-monooxygenase
MVRTLIQTDGGAVSAPPFGLSTIGALGALLVFALSGTGLAGPGVTLAAALAIILLGLPHGAYDLQLLVKPRPGRRLPDWRLAAAYLGLLGCAAALWLLAPSAALLIFLVMAAVHFGEDWTMLEAGLLRHMSGFSIIAAVTIASPADVGVLFGLLSNAPFGALLARAIIMTAPIVLLVSLVAMALATARGHWRWSLAHLIALAIALISPPVVGFAAYFVLIHSAIHLRAARTALAHWPLARFCLYGLGISALSLGAMLLAHPRVALPDDVRWPLIVFQLLAILTVPHLLLTHRLMPGLDRWLARGDVSGHNKRADSVVLPALPNG